MREKKFQTTRNLFTHGTGKIRMTLHLFYISPDTKTLVLTFDFKLGMNIVYRDGKGNNVTIVYEGYRANGLLHNIRLEDGKKLDVQIAIFK